MSTIDDAIYNRISTDSDIIAFNGSISALTAKPGASMPMIIYNRVSTVPINALGTSSTLASSRFQFDCYSKDSSQASDLASKIKASLDAFFGTILGVTIGGIMMIDQFSIYESDAELYRETIDFNVMHSI